MVLREFRKEDIQSVYENYGSDPKVNRFISFAPCANLDSTKDFIAMHLQQYETNPSFYGWAITLNDEVIGSIGLFNVEEESEQCELGYSLGSRWWGNGYTTEAATEVLSYAFEQLKSVISNLYKKYTYLLADERMDEDDVEEFRRIKARKENDAEITDSLILLAKMLRIYHNKQVYYLIRGKCNECRL